MWSSRWSQLYRKKKQTSMISKPSPKFLFVSISTYYQISCLIQFGDLPEITVPGWFPPKANSTGKPFKVQNRLSRTVTIPGRALRCANVALGNMWWIWRCWEGLDSDLRSLFLPKHFYVSMSQQCIALNVAFQNRRVCEFLLLLF